MIRKIRDFIIGFRFKKYGHRKQGIIKFDFDFKPWLRAMMAYSISEMGKEYNKIIMSTIAKTKEEKKKKHIALAQNVINTAIGIIKVYARFK